MGRPKQVRLDLCEAQEVEMQVRLLTHSQSAMGEESGAAVRFPPQAEVSITCLGRPKNDSRIGITPILESFSD